MAAHKPIIHVFKEINIGKYRSVKHYELLEVKNGISFLSDKINISKNRNYALSMPDYWLRIRQDHKWSNYITGLFKVNDCNVYKGDFNKRQNLILFKFSDDAETIMIYYFRNYFTNDLSKVLQLIIE